VLSILDSIIYVQEFNTARKLAVQKSFWPSLCSSGGPAAHTSNRGPTELRQNLFIGIRSDESLMA
jgi:hypothetical protein